MAFLIPLAVTFSLLFFARLAVVVLSTIGSYSIERVIVVADSSVIHNDAYAAERIALALGGRRVGNHWEARCPAHDDRHPSFHIAYKDNKVLVKCWGGCSQESVIETLQERGLWGEGAHLITSKLVGQFDTSHGLKVEQLAEYKGLPTDILLGYGLTTITYNCRSVVRIPYLDEGGDEVAVRFRLALEEVDGNHRFTWRTGDMQATLRLQ